MVSSVNISTTSPDQIADVSSRYKALTAAAVVERIESGIASNFWSELIPYPPSPPRLWLEVSGSWRLLDNPSTSIHQSVQDAFAQAATFEVAVWYDGQTIVGLVVRTK